MSIWRRDTEVYSYQILWFASQSALQMANIKDKKVRPDHLAIHSFLSGFSAFEGFLNFVGEEIAPEAWDNERQFFTLKSGYRGIDGKVKYLFSKFSDIELDENSEPYINFRKMNNIRNHLVHNRVNRYEEESVDENPSFRTHWEDFDTPEKVKPCLDCLKEFAETIRIEAVKLLVDNHRSHRLHFPAFSGPILHSEGMGV